MNKIEKETGNVTKETMTPPKSRKHHKTTNGSSTKSRKHPRPPMGLQQCKNSAARGRPKLVPKQNVY